MCSAIVPVAPDCEPVTRKISRLESLLPRDCVPRLDDSRFFDKQVPNGEVDGVAAALDAHAEHVVVHEVVVEHELDGFSVYLSWSAVRRLGGSR